MGAYIYPYSNTTVHTSGVAGVYIRRAGKWDQWRASGWGDTKGGDISIVFDALVTCKGVLGANSAEEHCTRKRYSKSSASWLAIVVGFSH